MKRRIAYSLVFVGCLFLLFMASRSGADPVSAAYPPPETVSPSITIEPSGTPTPSKTPGHVLTLSVTPPYPTFDYVILTTFAAMGTEIPEGTAEPLDIDIHRFEASSPWWFDFWFLGLVFVLIASFLTYAYIYERRVNQKQIGDSRDE